MRPGYSILADRSVTTADKLAIVIVTMLPKVPSLGAQRHFRTFPAKGVDRAELSTKFEVLRLATDRSPANAKVRFLLTQSVSARGDGGPEWGMSTSSRR